MQINIIGDVIGNSGYCSHIRQFANALYKAGADVRLDSQKPPGWESQVNDAELNMLTKLPDKDRCDIAVTLPHMWPYHLAQRPAHFIGFLVWEGDSIPPFWMKHLIDKRVDTVFVPSQHTKDAILTTFKSCAGLDNIKEGKVTMKDWDKIKIVPHGVDRSLFFPIEKKKDKFCFLANKGWTKPLTDRGGLQFIIQAFAAEFNKNEKVKLLLKVNKSYAPDFDVREAIKQLGITKPVKERPEILVTESMVPYKELNNIYNEGDVFVSASMAEGFNLPVLEGMACGMPAIVTNFGGHCDFVDKSNGWKVRTETYHVKDDIQYEGISWGKVHISCLRKAMRKVFDLHKQGKLERYKDGALNTSMKYTWDNSAKIALDIINDL